LHTTPGNRGTCDWLGVASNAPPTRKSLRGMPMLSE
jgi:hypothetical protein